MCRKWIAVYLIYFLTACDYRGDGEYLKYGTWPFDTYTLIFPEFDFNSNFERTYFVNGYDSYKTSLLTIKLSSDSLLQYEKLNTELEIRFVDEKNKAFFSKRAPLNRHYLRMVDRGEAVVAASDEWSGRYIYSSLELRNRVIPFSTDMIPEPSDFMYYTQLMPIDSSEFKMIIKIGEVPVDFQGVDVQISLASGWK